MSQYKLLVAAPLAGGLALLAACSSSSSTPTTTPTPSPTSTATASASPSISNNVAMNLSLTEIELPSNPSGPLSQVSDGLLGGKTNTDQRVFANADHSLAIEADLIVETTSAGVTSDYPPIRDAAKGRVTTLSASSSPSIGDHADEYVGTTTDGKNIVAIAFSRALTVDVVLVETGAGTTLDPSYVEAVAGAMDSKIQSHA
ncbi:MAG TPA: hypothetical protein VNY76_00410 [Candidatus Acidoferrales bacterium]|jgi:hypothetical protein|nr:hypothetical protein [Candidatus Acidoferrales bacterium]